MTEKKYFKNRKTWKQVSTNLPPHMHQALRNQVTSGRTMSHVLRELIADSALMRGGEPKTNWPLELANELAELRKEIADLKADVKSITVSEPDTVTESEEAVEPEYPNLFEDDIEFYDDLDDWSSIQAFLQRSDEEKDEKPEPVKETPRSKPFSFVEKLTDMFAIGRKSA